MVEQQALRRLFLASVAARGHALDDVADLVDEQWRPRAVEGGTGAVVILRRFRLEQYMRGAATFVATLEPSSRDAWYRAFTRTIFLVGDPRRIADRLADLPGHRTADVAWVWSAAERSTLGLRRLLKPLRTSGRPALEPERECTLKAFAGGPRKQLCLATAGLALEDYLVQLNHLLCESLITGALSPEHRILVRHVAEVESLPPRCAHVRVVPQTDGGDSLRVAGYLAPEER